MKANKAKALQPINSYPEFEPSRAIKQSHMGIIELMMNPEDEGLQTVMQNIN